MPATYREDLAFIHESGHTRFAEGAARLLRERLATIENDCRYVIDLGCGGGTLSAAVDAAGYDVLGYDLSESMIALARARVPRGTFVVGSFVDARLPACRAVAAIGEIFCYLSDERNSDAVLQGVLERIHAALVPGGLLVFDVAGQSRQSAQRTQQFRNEADWSVLVASHVQENLLTREITSYRRVKDMYRRDEEVHQLRLLDPGHVADLLERVGFDVQQTAKYADVDLPTGLHGFVACKE